MVIQLVPDVMAYFKMRSKNNLHKYMIRGGGDTSMSTFTSKFNTK